MQFQGFDWLSIHGVQANIKYHAQEKASITGKLSSACSKRNQQDIVIFLDCF